MWRNVDPSPNLPLVSVPRNKHYIVISALDEEAYGVFLYFTPGLGVFTLERSFCIEKVVMRGWNQLKGRPIPQTHQEFVDSKQRLRAALRNLKTIVDVPSNDDYRRYRITDLPEIRVKCEQRSVATEINSEPQDIPVLPRRSGRKIKIEKCMYDDDDSSESWTDYIKPRKPRRQINSRKNTCLKETGIPTADISVGLGKKIVTLYIGLQLIYLDTAAIT